MGRSGGFAGSDEGLFNWEMARGGTFMFGDKCWFEGSDGSVSYAATVTVFGVLRLLPPVKNYCCMVYG